MPRVESECAGQAKAAMEYLVRTNALRFGPHNITVNAVIPGIVESEAWDKCGSEVQPPNLFPVQKPLLGSQPTSCLVSLEPARLGMLLTGQGLEQVRLVQPAP